MIRVHGSATGQALKPRLRLAIMPMPVATTVAGLAAVPGLHLHDTATLVCQPLFKVAPAGGQDTAVQARLGHYVGPRRIHRTPG